MDWGLGNPNKTAALIAILMVTVWSLDYVKKYGFWLALTCFAGLGICLMYTISRGGLAAAFAGLSILAVWQPWPWERSKVVAMGISIWIILGFSLYLNTQDRYLQGTDDLSILNRLEIWKKAPQMMVDAPGGWGWGNSGKAYVEWYQPVDRSEDYRTLVNSHLTWLVEFGWPVRFLYLFAWGVMVLLCWPSKENRWWSIPLGIWATFFVAAIFSSVAESPWLWIVPILSLLPVLFSRWIKKTWPRPLLWSLPVAVSCLILLIFWILGQGKSNIHDASDIVTFGNGTPTDIVLLNEKTMGKIFGHAIRRVLAKASSVPSVEVVGTADHLPDLKGKKLILGGQIQEIPKVAALIHSAFQIVLLNPDFFPQQLNLSPDEAKNTEIVFGEFSQSPALHAWDQVGTVKRIDGTGDFLPNWADILLEGSQPRP